MEIPVQRTLYRVLPASLQEGKEIDVIVVLFTQGINEQQSLADRYVMVFVITVKTKLHRLTTPIYRGFGDSTLQDQINLRSLQQLTNYFTRFKERFGSASKSR